MENYSNTELLSELERRLTNIETSNQIIDRLNMQIKELNDKLQQAEEIKSHFLSNVRNQIINPFESILGLSKNILHIDKNNLDKIRRHSQLIYTEAFELDFQLKNIFAAAKIEAGDTEPEFRLFNLQDLCDDVVRVFENKLENKQIQIEKRFELAKDGIEKRGFVTDPFKLELILANLINNAIEYSPSCSKIEMSVWYEDYNLIIEVKDHGIGIETIDQKIIFDRFKKLDSSINSINKGHGLGLSIVKAFLDLINGQIFIQSKKTVGSIFTIILPEQRENMDDGFLLSGDDFISDDVETF